MSEKLRERRGREEARCGLTTAVKFARCAKKRGHGGQHGPRDSGRAERKFRK